MSVAVGATARGVSRLAGFSDTAVGVGSTGAAGEQAEVNQSRPSARALARHVDGRGRVGYTVASIQGA
jgi:hypothetical protein